MGANGGKIETGMTKRAVKKRFSQYMVCWGGQSSKMVYSPLERNDVTKLIYIYLQIARENKSQ